jgi:hypothetical protein
LKKKREAEKREEKKGIAAAPSSLLSSCSSHTALPLEIHSPSLNYKNKTKTKRKQSSDEEHHDVHFESSESGASLTFPQQAGTIRKSAHLVIKGRPCKVADVSTSKTGEL